MLNWLFVDDHNDKGCEMVRGEHLSKAISTHRLGKEEGQNLL